MKILLGTAWIILVATTAAAQGTAAYTSNEMRNVFYDYGHCVVKKRYKSARTVIVENLNNRDTISNHASLFDSRCLIQSDKRKNSAGVEMRLKGDMIRYAVSDALVAKDFSEESLLDFSIVEPLGQSEVIEEEFTEALAQQGISERRVKELQDQRAVLRSDAYLAQYGECVVRSNSSGAHALIMSKPATEEEALAFAVLRPSFNVCLENGKKLSINKLMLRGTVAVNFYRLASAARAAGSGVAR